MASDLFLDTRGDYGEALRLGREILQARRGGLIRPSQFWLLLNQHHTFRIRVHLPTGGLWDLTASPSAQIIEAKIVLAGLTGLVAPASTSPENTDDSEYRVF